MQQFIAGVILIGIVVGGFYFLGNKIGVFERDNSGDDYSCH
jgi:hypothetical protein